MTDATNRDVHVLVVDDERGITEILSRTLASAGYTVSSANSGEQALELFRRERPAVVLSDIKMPGMDGITLVERLVTEEPTTAVVMVTAVHDVDEAVLAMRSGACDYFTKPFDLPQVLRHVEAATRWYRLKCRERDHDRELAREVELKTRDLSQANRHLKETGLEVIRVLANIVEAKDPFTLGHSERVAYYSLELARRMGEDHESQETIQIASLLHDIGKLGIEDAILLKPGPLNYEETREMRRHPEIGAKLLEPIALNPRIKEYTYTHHERHDGRGYPRGIGGQEIPPGARILIISEVFDALVTERSYKSAWPVQKAETYIRNHAGQHFHPETAKEFLELLRERSDGLVRDAGRRFEPQAETAALGVWTFEDGNN